MTKVAHGHSGHYKVVCKRCYDIISQCRCPAVGKATREDICFKCLRKQTVEDKE